MKRTQVYFTQEQLQYMGEMYTKTGIPMAEFVRRAINEKIERDDGVSEDSKSPKRKSRRES